MERGYAVDYEGLCDWDDETMPSLDAVELLALDDVAVYAGYASREDYIDALSVRPDEVRQRLEARRSQREE